VPSIRIQNNSIEVVGKKGLGGHPRRRRQMNADCQAKNNDGCDSVFPSIFGSVHIAPFPRRSFSSTAITNKTSPASLAPSRRIHSVFELMPSASKCRKHFFVACIYLYSAGKVLVNRHQGSSANFIIVLSPHAIESVWWARFFNESILV
jgi:hypothetical protein